MLRRKPTRVELKPEDRDEYKAFKEERERNKTEAEKKPLDEKEARILGVPANQAAQPPEFDPTRRRRTFFQLKDAA